jgi:hypothetical protein
MLPVQRLYNEEQLRLGKSLETAVGIEGFSCEIVTGEDSETEKI